MHLYERAYTEGRTHNASTQSIQDALQGLTTAIEEVLKSLEMEEAEQKFGKEMANTTGGLMYTRLAEEQNTKIAQLIQSLKEDTNAPHR